MNTNMSLNTDTLHRDTVLMTSRGLRRLRTELGLLKQTALALQRDIRQATLEFEEDLYREKRWERLAVQAKLSKLESVLRRVRPLVPGRRSVVAEVGHLVTYRQDQFTHTVRLVSTWEADPSRGCVSCQSPLGAALCGKRKGDVAFMVTPAGERKVQILAVR